DAGGGGDVLERAVAAIHEQRVGISEPAVREIKIWPSVVVHVGHRDGRTQGSDERRDVVELRIQGRPVMHEVDAHLGGDVGQVELGNRGIAAGALPPAVQNEHEDDGGQKRRGDGDLGLVYLREGRLGEAEAQLRRAAALVSSNNEIVLMLAEVYRLSGREVDARHELDRVLHSDSTDIRALYALARLAAQAADP